MQLSHQAFKRLGRLHNLKILDLNSSGLSDQDLPLLQGLSKLEHINVSNCQITAAGFQKFLSHMPPSLVYTCGETRRDDASNIGKLAFLNETKRYAEATGAIKKKNLSLANSKSS